MNVSQVNANMEAWKIVDTQLAVRIAVRLRLITNI